MKCKVFRILVVLTIAAFALLAHAEEAQLTTEIKGYMPGKLSVEGTVGWQLAENVVGPIRMQLARIKNASLTIKIVSYGDSTGSDAKTVATCLHATFQQSRITYSWQKNTVSSPMVVITSIITDATPPAPEGWLERNRIMIFVMIFVIVAVLIMLNEAMMHNHQPQPVPIAAPQPILMVEWNGFVYSFEWNGKRYFHEMREGNFEGKDGYLTGLPNPLNFRKEISDAKKAVNGYLKDSANQPAIEQLIANGRFTPEKGEDA